MAKDATAKITFSLENADEVLTLLRQLKTFVDSGGGASAGGSVSGGPAAPGTPSGTGTAAPPVGPAPMGPVQANPGANAAAMPQNMAYVGTAGNTGGLFGTWNGAGFSNLMFDPIAGRYFDPSNGSYMLGGGGMGMGGGGGPQGFGAGAKPPAPAPMGAGGQFLGALATFGVGHQIGAAAGQMANSWATADVNGQVFRPERLLPGGIALGGIAAGAIAGGIATAWTGPGAIIGAGVGALAGGIIGDAMRPHIERNINEDELRRFAYGLNYTDHFRDSRLGGLPNDMIENVIRGLGSGRYLGADQYADIDRRFPDSPLRRGLATSALEAARYADGNVMKYGLPTANEYLSPGQRRDMLIGASYGNELATAQALENEGLPHQAKKMRASYVDRIRMENELEGNAAEMGVAGSRFSRAARYGGSSAASAASGDYLGRAGQQASLLRQQAAKIQNQNPGRARALMAQAEQLEMDSGDQVADTIYGTQVEESAARSAAVIGRAERGFATSLYGGAAASALPWDQKSGAYRSQANEIRKLMAERGDRLSPAERMRMQEQIDQLNFKADFEVPREREGMINSERLAGTGLSNARIMSGEMPGIMRGSAEDQTRQFELQADALSRVRATYEEILRTSRYLTNEQRIQYATQIENLKVDEERARVSGIYAKNAAVRQTIETGNVESGVSPTIALIRGAGGAAGSAAQAELLGLTDANISASEAELAANIDSGMSPDSPQNQAIRTRISSMRIGRENQQRALAVSPMSAGDRASRSNLQTESAFYQAGYGSFGDIRGNLLDQIKMVEKRMDDLSANRTKIRAGKVNGVSWTDAMEADFVEARNQSALEALQLSEQYNFGYDQRLISQAYNMSGNGRLAMSQFTRREAAAAGVFHRALGGSESQTRSMREMYPNMTRAMGSGNPMNFADRALAGEGRSHSSVEVVIRVQDGTGRIRDNDVQVVNQKTSTDMTVNVQAAKRPSG